jgi:hypothetical protein
MEINKINKNIESSNNIDNFVFAESYNEYLYGYKKKTIKK